MKHTPEPWQLASPLEVADVCEVTPLDGSDASRVTARANTARIAACVNACTGLSDPTAALNVARSALSDARQSLSLLQDKEGAFRITCIHQIDNALKLLNP